MIFHSLSFSNIFRKMNIFIAFQLFLCIFSLQTNFENGVAKKVFKFEIQFKIADAKYNQKDKIEEETMKAFIGEMKKLIITNVPANINAEKKCEKFENDKDAKFKKILALDTIRNMVIGKDKIIATDHCLQNWILYLHLAEISAEIVENLKDANDSKIYKRILGPKFVNGKNQHWKFLDNLNRFSHKIVKQLNPQEKIGRLRSLTNRAMSMSIFKKNDAKDFYDLLKTLNVQIRVKKMEEIEKAKSVKFEIGFRIPGFEKEEITLNEIRTTAFIAEIQKMINKKIPNVIDKICEYFLDKYTGRKELKSISELLKGEDEIDASSECLHKWIQYLFLGKISKNIIEHLKMAKNHKIYERILGTTKVDEQWELMKNLDKFLIDLDERLSEVLTTKSGRMFKISSVDMKRSEEKDKYYTLLKDLEKKLTIKMEGTDNEKEEEKKNKSPPSRKETPIFTDSDESSSFELSSASSSDESLFDFIHAHKHSSSEEENGQNHHDVHSQLPQQEKKLEKMHGKLQKQQNELKEMQNLKKKLQKELKETENRIQSHEKEIENIQKEIDEMKHLIKEQQQKEEEEKQRRLKQRQQAKENKAKQRKTPRPRARQETRFQHHIQQSSHTYVQSGNNYGNPVLCTIHYSSFCQTSYPIY